MECCNGITDYRYNGVNNTNTSYHYPYGYYPSNAMRYQHASSYRNNVAVNGGGGSGISNSMTCDRYNTSYNYNNGPYGYNSNATNQYYSNQYSSHDSYKYFNSTNHLQQSYHHRELFADSEQQMYRSRHNYMMRDQSYHHHSEFQLNNSSASSSARGDHLPNHSMLSNGPSIDSAANNHHYYNQNHYYPYHQNTHYHHNTHHHHQQYQHNGYGGGVPYNNDYMQHPSSASSYYNNGYLANNDTSSTGMYAYFCQTNSQSVSENTTF